LWCKAARQFLKQQRNPVFCRLHIMVCAIFKLFFGLGTLQQTAGLLRNGYVWKQSHSGSWIEVPAVAQRPTNGRNLCIDGKRVPDLYVLGVQKSGTTTMYMDLHDAGGENVHGAYTEKEFHFFDYTIEKNESIEQNKEQWLSLMPPCSDRNRVDAPRSIFGDLTPDYLRLVQRPPDYIASKDLVRFEGQDISMPWRLNNFYANQSSKLNFAILLREPLSQMQSSWYHTAAENFTAWVCRSCKGTSFRAVLQQLITGMKRQELTGWVWVTMYARQIEEWLKSFKASQFYVVPMHYNSGVHKEEVCRDMSVRLGYTMGCRPEAVEKQAWSHDHPSVDEDAGPALRAEFDALMAKEKTRLVNLLAESHSAGMGLAAYHGPRGDREAIRQWLEAGW